MKSCHRPLANCEGLCAVGLWNRLAAAHACQERAQSIGDIACGADSRHLQRLDDVCCLHCTHRHCMHRNSLKRADHRRGVPEECRPLPAPARCFGPSTSQRGRQRRRGRAFYGRLEWRHGCNSARMGKLRARIHHKAQSEIGRRQLGGGSGTTERDYSTCEVDPLAHVVQKLVVSLAYGRLPMNDEMFTPSMCRPSSARICDGAISA